MTESRPRLPTAYWRQFSASLVSNLGDGANAAAMPLLAISLTQDTRLISAVSFSSMIPWLFLSLPAGVFIDRWDRKTVMVIADSLRALMYALVAVLVAVDSLSIWVLLVVLLVIGCAEVFFDMSAQAFLPSIVPEEQLHRANGLLYAAEIVWGSFIGLPVGSWLFVVAAGVPFGINGASFALAAVLVASITVRTPPDPATTGGEVTTSFVTDLKEGLRWLRGHRNLRTLAVLLGVTNGAMMLGEAIFVKFAFRHLGVGPKGYGLLLAVTSGGAIIGGLLGDRIAKRLGVSASIISAYVIFAVADVIRAAWPSVILFAAMSVLVALAGTVWNVVTVSYRQRVIPAELFGRVNSAYRFIGTGSIGIGALVGGQVAHYAGLRAPYFLGSTVTLVALVWGLPTLRSPGFAAVGD
ncbi:MAG: MFS transporter [Actinobacteria bacterium]|nr:MFS transporter [Actinomycetota bacterium]